MEELTFKSRYLKALGGESLDRVPVPAFCTHPLVELMECTGLFAPDIHSRATEMVDFALSGYEILGFEGVRLPTDGVLEAEAVGCKIDLGMMDRNPSVVVHPLHLDDVEIPRDFLQRGRIPLVLEAVRAIRASVGEQIPVTSHFMGPVTISCHLVGPGVFLLGLLENPQTVRKTLVSVTDLCVQMGRALVNAGVDVLQLPDPMASSEIISPAVFDEFVSSCYRRIFQSVPGPVVLHICGNSAALLPRLRGIGAAGFSFDACVSVLHAREVLGSDMALVGNISTTDVLLKGSTEDVRREAIKAIREGIDVLAPACGFAPRTTGRRDGE